MGIDELQSESLLMTRWERYRFFALIIGVIIIAAILVVVGLWLYRLSGAEQVDLSRPGYQSIQKEAARDKTADAFPATGVLDAKSFNSFYAMYDKRAKRVTNVTSFDSKTLSEESMPLITEPDQSLAPNSIAE